MDAVRDGFVPGSSTPLRALVALAVGVVLALLLARLLHRRAPALAAGAGLVLLLVAVTQSLVDAADLLTDRDAPPPWGVGLALAAGLGVGAAVPRQERSGPWRTAAVVLASLPVLAPALETGTVDFVDATPPDWYYDVRTALVGLLLGGALAAVRPGRTAAALGVAGLVVVSAASPLVDPPLVHAVAAGLVLAVLLPHLLSAREDDADLRRGLLLGLVLVGLVTAGRGALTTAIDETLFGPGGREGRVERELERVPG